MENNTNSSIKTADEIKTACEEYCKAHDERVKTNGHKLLIALSNRLFDYAKQAGASTIRLTDAEATNREILKAAMIEAKEYGLTIKNINSDYYIITIK